LGVTKEFEMNKDFSKINFVFLSKDIEVKASQIHGLGVFATALIPVGQLIESAPVLLMHGDTICTLNDVYETRHILNDYVFTGWDEQVALCFGYGSLYNYGGADANCHFSVAKEQEFGVIHFWSKRDIEAGEELTIDYYPGNDAIFCADGSTWVSDDTAWSIDGLIKILTRIHE